MNYSTETVNSTVIRTAARMKAFLNGIYKGPNKNMPPDLLSILLTKKKKKKKRRNVCTNKRLHSLPNSNVISNIQRS